MWRLWVVVAALAFVLPPSGAVAGAPTDLLPDLVQERPRDISLRTIGGRARLGFTSAVHNAGRGPLVVTGRRATRSIRDMTARQIVARSDGSTRTLQNPVGLLRYVRSADHSHWHYRPFERYSLVDEGGHRVARDAKSGFCLGDRYRARQVSNAARQRYIGACGLRRTGLLSLTEGISVGWGDDYAGYLEGQSIDVTAVAPGRYRLVHTVNGTGGLLESNMANNSASASIELVRRGGVMRVRVLG